MQIGKLITTLLSRQAADRSLRLKFARVVTFFALGAGAVSGMLGYYVADRVLASQVSQRLELVSQERIRQIHNYIETQDERMKLVVSRTRLRELLKGYQDNTVSISELRDSALKILLDTTSHARGILALWIVNSSGVVLVSTDPYLYEFSFAGHELLRQGEKHFFLDYPRKIDNHYVTRAAYPLPISSEVWLNRDHTLVLMAALNAKPLSDLLLKPFGTEKSGRVVLTKIGALPEGGIERFPPGVDTNLGAQNYKSLLLDGAKQKVAMVENGREVGAFYLPLGYRDWGILSQVDKSEIDAPLKLLRENLFLLVAGVGSIILLLSWYLINTVTVPLSQLEHAASRIAQGDFSSRVSIDRQDELGALGMAFNNMASGLEAEISVRRGIESELRSVNETLEARIEDRTTLLLESQTRLRKSERMASLGALAAGIAHEINNPVGAMVLAAENALAARGQAMTRPQSLALLERTCGKVLAHAKRCQQVVQGVLAFAKREGTEKQQVDLNELISRALLLAKASFELENLEIILSLKKEMKTVFVNPLEVEQAIVQLLKNSIEARSSKIEISTQDFENCVQLKICDDGEGIAESCLEHVFDPFFTTKLHQGGTGLGLSIVHGNICGNEGSIHIESERGVGTTAVIEFRQAEVEVRTAA